MKISSLIKISVLFSFFLLCVQATLASEPTLPSSNVSFAYVDAGQFNINFTSGNGSGRIVVVKEGSDISARPSDGISYGTGNIGYGVLSSQIAAGEFVVFAGTGSGITITGLKKATTYYVAIFEFNGSLSTPSSLDYSSLTPTGQHTTTLATPTLQAQITSFSQITGNAARINYTNGNGTGRMVVVRKGTSITAVPTDYTFYNSSTTFKSSTSSAYYIDAETFIIQKSNASNTGANSYADVVGLEPNTTYTFAVFEYNSNQNASAPAFLSPAAVQTMTTNAGPTKAASSLSFAGIDGDRLTLNWAYGNGTKRIVIAKKGSPVTAVPVNNTSYTANSKLGLGQQIATDEYVVYNNAYSGVTVTGLEKAINYYFAIFEYDVDGAGNIYYQQISPATASSSTAVAPTVNTTIAISNITGSSAQMTYNVPASGAGYYRMLVIKDGSATDFLPADGMQYGAGSSTYGSGTQVSPGTYVLINQANGGAGSVTNLTPGHTYYVTVFDMNGYYAPVYLTPGYTAVINVPAEPTTASTNLTFSNIEGNAIQLNWTNGGGARRIVVAHKNTAVSTVPLDGTTYTASTVLGAGSELSGGMGEYVVYDGTYNSVTITNLEKATTYQFAIFEYNNSSSGPDYLTTTGKWLAGQKSTAAAPTSSTTNISAYNILSTQVSINYSVGNGSNRLFVVHEGAPVNAAPQDLQSYTYNGVFGSGQQIGIGNFAVASGSSAFLLSNLKPGTQYYITAFEFNGSSAPVYNTSGNTVYSFTTATAPATVPTQPAQSPVFSMIDGNKFRFAWTSGNGSARIVVARAGNPVSFIPADGTAYVANAAFGSTADLGNGQFIVFNGSTNSVDITNLSKATTYYFAVFEYNGTGATTKYLSASLTANGATASAPTQISSNASIVPGNSSASLSFNSGNGNARLIVVKEGAAISGRPSDLTVYSANAAFQSGTQIAAGEYVVYNGAANSITITGLSAGKTYYFSVFEYNGTDAPVYNKSTSLSGSFSITSTLPVKWIYVRAQKGTSETTLTWAAEETNVLSYTIERSTNGINFSSIGEVSATSFNGINDYHFSDRSVNGTKCYYRIKETDRDGRYSYSITVVTDALAITGVRMLQNPVKGNFVFECRPEIVKSYSIVNAAGVRLVNKQVTSIITSDMIQGSAGIYYLLLYSKDGSVTTIPFVYRP